MDVESAAGILTESHTCLTEAESRDLIHTLICTVIQTKFMEIQQKDNETLAAYIHHFKRAAKQCSFDNDTAAICIFVKGLRDASIIASKIYEKDPQTLAEVIRLVEKLSTAHQPQLH